MEAEQSELQRAGEWYVGPSDLMSVMRRSRRELEHCSVIKWLLDPRSPHGLGTRFAKRFMGGISPDRVLDEEDLWRGRARVEVVRDDTRADIVYKVPDKDSQVTVIVEAKVNAEEGLHQCRNTFKAWKDEEGAVFVFLTPCGRPPTSAGVDLGKFVLLSFSEIREWLESLVSGDDQSKSQAGRRTLLSYIDTLKKEFN